MSDGGPVWRGTIFDWLRTRDVLNQGFGFYPMLWALMSEADPENFARLESVFPMQAAEFKDRLAVFGGALDPHEEYLLAQVTGQRWPQDAPGVVKR